MSKILTIIMIARNNLDLTKKALESLAETTGSSLYKLVFFDNGSIDNTYDWVDNFCLKKNIEYKYKYTSENIGWIKAVNKGYEICDTEFVLTVHNDVIFAKQWLPNMLRRFEDKSVAAVGPVITFCMGLQRAGIAFSTFGAKVKFLLGLFFMCRKSVLEEIKYENGEYLASEYTMGDKEELELCSRITDLGYRLEIARDVIIEHTGEKTFIDALGSQEAFHDYQKKQEIILRDRLGNDKVDDLFKVEYEKPVKLLIGVPTRTSYVHFYFMAALLQLYGRHNFYKEVFHIPRGMPAESRNRIVEYALAGDYTHVLMVDDDMVFDDTAILKLLAHDVDVCTGIAFQRVEPYTVCVFRLNTETNLFNPITPIKQGFGEVDAVGGFFLLIKIEVLRKLNKPHFEYADKSLGLGLNSGGIGEDIYFCTKAKRAGFRVWSDTDVIIKHIGLEQLIDDKTHLEYNEKNINQEIEQKEFVI